MNKIKQIEIAGKTYPFFASINVVDCYYEQLKKFNDEQLETSDRAYRELLANTIIKGIESGYYIKGGFNRILRRFKSPSINHLFNTMDLDYMMETIKIIFANKAKPSEDESEETEVTKKK